MFTRLYVEAILKEDVLADEVWKLWSTGHVQIPGALYELYANRPRPLPAGGTGDFPTFYRSLVNASSLRQ